MPESIAVRSILTRLSPAGGPGGDSNWRPHIDGLRALAVLSVLFYHSGVVEISGGFVGVDVFFVISGFLISKIIYDDIAAHGRFRIVRFYERRARRILPAFVVVTAASLVAGYFLFLPAEFSGLARSAVYASGFLANVFFYRTSEYFGPDANTQPLLHYWSLGVEEQFYIVFPVVILVVSKVAPRRLGVAVLAIGAASLALAEFYLQTAPTAAFYLTPPRAWELMAGSALALADFPRPKVRLAREAAALIGLALIVGAALVYRASTPFPGLTAIVPVAGSALILWAGEGGPTVIGGLLGFRPLRHVGLWSYSIYMIHWPIIVFAHAVWPKGSEGFAVIVIAASVALGWLSYAIVETPFRQPGQMLARPYLFAASAGALAALAGLGLTVSLADGLPNRLPAPVRRVLAYNNYDFGPLYREHLCFLTVEQRWDDLQSACLRITRRPMVLLWGDSHAAHFYGALKARFKDVDILQANMASCPPMVGFASAEAPHCREFNDKTLGWTLENKPDAVILSAMWTNHELDLPGLDATINALHAAETPVIIAGETPRFADTVPNILARRLMQGDSDLRARPDDGLGAQFWGDRDMKERYSNRDGVRYISTQDTVCAEGQCPLETAAGVPLFWDSDHFTREGADFFLQHMFGGWILPERMR